MLPVPFDQLQKHQTKRRTLSKGDIVFREGEPTRGMFFIVNGAVELCRYTSTGDSVIMHTARASEMFAEASLFVPHYHCDAQAIAVTDIVELTKSSLLHLFESDIAFATSLTQLFASQVMNGRRKIELMSMRNANDRVYNAFLDGLMKNNIKSFAIEIGLSHEVVYRSLSKLVKQGRLNKISKGNYSLPNKF
ncbi:MAG: CRP-like cAMP-binding protein [Candidatus Endobugula sp.]|jgi:CRP-like cAMP-binding protein